MKKIQRTLAALLAAAIFMQAAPMNPGVLTALAEETASSSDKAESSVSNKEPASSAAASASEPASSQVSSSEAESESNSNSESEADSSSQAASDSTPESEAADSDSQDSNSNSADEEPADDEEASSDDVAEQDGETVNAAAAGELKLIDSEDTIAQYNKKTKTITINTDDTYGSAEKQLILLSNCTDIDQWKDYTIKISNAGIIDLLNSVDGYSFQGIGTAGTPFEGTIQPVEGASAKINRAFFGGLSSKAKITDDKNNNIVWSLSWCGDGSKPMIADTYEMESGTDENGTESTEHTLPIKVTAGDITVEGSTSKATMGSLLGTVKGTGTLKITGSVADYTGATAVAVTMGSGNAGLICGTLKSGNITIVSDYALPGSYSVKASGEYAADDKKLASGNAGGLIGAMDAGTTLTIEGERSISAAVTANNGNAGGLVGLMMDGAKIVTPANVQTSAEGEEAQAESTNSIILNSQTITGGASAGGVVGDAADVTFSDTDLQGKITVTSPTLKGSQSGANVGGLAGKYTLTKQGTYSLPANIELTSPSVTINGALEIGGGNEGGYFGLLQLSGKGITYTIGKDSQENANTAFFATCEKEQKVEGEEEKAQSYGGLIGQLLSSDAANTLKIQNITVNSTYTTAASGQRPGQHGGLIGCIGEAENNTIIAYVAVEKVTVTVTNPHADWNFGGVASYLAENCILQVKGVTVKTKGTTDNKIYEGGGILGVAKAGSALELSGTTDLSGVSYTQPNKVAQLVQENENALIYAKGSGSDTGWKYIRGQFDGKFNDIGQYGQVIRLKSSDDSTASQLSSKLIQIEESTHQVTFNKAITCSDNTITLSDADDFALLSIAISTQGKFSSITTEKDLLSKNITLSGNINLKGSGITGLGRDSKTETAFTGTLNGGSHTITLAIGETYGYKDENTPAQDHEANCGIVYGNDNYHAAQGIFAKTQNDAKIENLTIDGSICVSNGYKAVSAGGIAGFINTGTDTGKTPITINNVTAKETIYADGSNAIELAVGGLYGQNEQNGYLKLEKDVVCSANITLGSVGNRGSYIYAGGVVGCVKNNYFKLAVNDLTLKGNITSDATDYAYAGGLIGLITGGGSDNKDPRNHWMEIRKLNYNVFTIKAENATKVCGGLFGAIWENTGTYFMGKDDTDDGTDTKLTVTDASINAPNAKYVGGLLYRSSGNMEIRSQGIDLQKFTITAKDNVGLLVCRGYTSISNNNDTKETIAGNPKEMKALYLVTTKHWEDSYKIGDNVTISGPNNAALTGVFDEFVAYTVNDCKTIVDESKNQGGIISIATKEENKKRVGVDKNDECTTYQNRTTYGNENKTNGYSRYYYDLDKCLSEAQADTDHKNNSQIDTPQELMLWSVYIYACDNIKGYFSKDVPDIKDVGGITISGMLNMKGYSYYTVNQYYRTVEIKDAAITFDNESIENAEESNKKTIGTDESHSQHYGMHCGLFFRYMGFNNNAGMKVQNTTFSGSIGKFGNTSGALVARAVYNSSGDQTDKNINVTLQTITLDGLKVTNYDTDKRPYAPLLINKIGDRVTLNVNGVSTKGYDSIKNDKNQAAGSSLLGQAGGSGTDKRISLSFSNISLPDKPANNGGIFTHATLLEWFSYTDGDISSNATYNFYAKDDNADTNKNAHHNVTYGNEINDYDTSHEHGTKEFTGMQKWYYEERTYKTDAGLVKDKTSEGKNSENFNSYLPYVFKAYGSDDNQIATESGFHYHEIKVNHRVADIVNGCGTYGHPYIITTEAQLEIIAEYIATTTPQNEWRVTVTSNMQSYHNSANAMADVTYEYDESQQKWVQVKQVEDSTDTWNRVTNSNGADITIDKNFMLEYLRNAYYDIQGSKTEDSNDSTSLTVDDFRGFGSAINPFRGVITSSNGTTLELTGSSNPLVVYSYGSVVKGLNIQYKTRQENSTTGKTGTAIGKTLDYKNDSNTNKRYDNAAFGGVIGYVLGGDNIIDGVSVSIGSNYLTLTDSTKNQDKKHLIPVGGYVGEVAGGGVIFRNMTDSTGLTNAAFTSDSGVSDLKGTDAAAYKNLYVNPYVGRVLDGLAFYEQPAATTSNDTESTQTATGTNYLTTLNNTNKNYQINTLTEASITVEKGTVTPQNAQGLLVLSAIVNSGAASGGYSNAYSNTASSTYKTSDSKASYTFAGKYGKVRNAAYDAIGTAVSNTDTEYKNSQADDFTIPSKDSLPYLIQKYGNKNAALFSLCSGMTVALKSSEEYDMSQFGTGYQGIGGRYASSAVLNGSTVTATNVIPQLNGFDGNNATITLDMQVKEYDNDDFSMASTENVRGMGGVFNLLRLKNDCTVSDLILKGANNEKGVIYQYYDSEGNVQSRTKDIHAGAFAGTNTGLSQGGNTGGKNNTIIFSNTAVENITVNSSKNAGGFIGYLSNRKSGAGAFLKSTDTNYNNTAIKIMGKSSYDSITVTANENAGGIVGKLDSITSNNEIQSSFTIANKSTIGTLSCEYAGGAFGQISSAKLQVNNTGTDKVAVNGVTVNAKYYAGGIVGLASCTNNSDSYIKNCSIVDSTINNINSDKNYYASGGIAGSIKNIDNIEGCTVSNITIDCASQAGGIVGQVTSTTAIKNCVVKSESAEAGSPQKGILKGKNGAGGIVSSVSEGNLSVEDCIVNNMSISNQNGWGCGGILGDVFGSEKKISMFNCSVKNSEIKTTNDDAMVGGFTGNVRGTLSASNLLLDGVSIHANNQYNVGMVVGKAEKDSTKNVYVAGLSIQSTKATYGTSNTPSTELCGNISNIEDKYYFAFADYFGSATQEDNDRTGLLGLTDTDNPQSPYVVTSPKGKLYVWDSAEDTATQKYLYGDGAMWEAKDQDGTFTMQAQKIIADADTTHYAYKDSDGKAYTLDSSWLSTYNANQNANEMNGDIVTQYHQLESDFPVLQISKGNTEPITRYLDIITNGGFSQANNLGKVTATAELYKLITANNAGKLVKDTENESALKWQKDSNGKITFSTSSDYDNNKDQFTLLTVTFSEKDTDGQAHNYNVYVPIIVRRMLEVDFSATLDYGTNFKSDSYDSLTNHVLESFGSSVTAYLNYQYNSDFGTFTPYGWQSYMDVGADMTQTLQKTVQFDITESQKLPKGTMLTLIDQESENAYYQTADGNTNSFKLIDFKDSQGNAYPERSLSELMGATAKSDNNGKYIQVDENGKPNGTESDGDTEQYSKPTVKIKNAEGGYDYYRLVNSGEKATHSIQVSENEVKNESFYLVITVPEESDSSALNGQIKGGLATTTIPNRVHQCKKDSTGNLVQDTSNGASSFILSKGYTQTLTENFTNNNQEGKLISAQGQDNFIKVDVVDAIQISALSYNASDQLYMRFVGSLQKTTTDNGKTTASAEQFPIGSSGKVKFYVYTQNSSGTKTYYAWTTSTDGKASWTQSESNQETAAIPERTWTSQGGNMELPLADENGNLISLQSLRDLKDKTGNTIYIRAQMDVTIPANKLDVIPADSTEVNNPSNFAKMSYVAQLSTTEQSLSYSSNQARLSGNNTKYKYYQKDTQKITLTYTADEINQLGINPLDLQKGYLEGDYSWIDTTARYDLAALKNMTETLQNAYGVQFTLTIVPKKSETGKTEEYPTTRNTDGTVKDAEKDSANLGTDAVQVALTKGGTTVEYNGTKRAWTWTVQPDQDGKWPMNGTELVQQIRLKVNTKDIAKYANYKVELTAELYGKTTDNNTAVQGNLVENTRASDYIIYTVAKIPTEFVDKASGQTTTTN